MSELDERRIGWGLGLAGGVLFGLSGLLSMALGTFNLALGHVEAGIGGFAAAVAALAVAGLAVLFSYVGNGRWKGYPLTPGLGLLVIGTVGGLWLGFGSVLALVAGLLVFLAGLLYLIPATVVGVKALTA